MRYRDIIEQRLPLTKRAYRRFGGEYPAFIIVLDPHDFVRLTSETDEEIKSIYDREFPMPNDEYVGRGGTEPGRFDMPYLFVEYPTGVIRGHEGRHRAAMVAKQGGKSYPVVVSMREPARYEVSYEIMYHPVFDPKTGELIEKEDEEKVEEWPDTPEFEARLAELRKLHDARTDFEAANERGYSIWDLKVTRHRGGRLRGHPERSDFDEYEYAAWRIEDFPKQLIGQYDHSVVVTDFRVGLAKGQDHYRR